MCVCWWVCESVGVCGWVFVFFLIHLFSLHAPLPCSNTTCIVYKLHVFSIVYTYNNLFSIYCALVVVPDYRVYLFFKVFVVCCA